VDRGHGHVLHDQQGGVAAEGQLDYSGGASGGGHEGLEHGPGAAGREGGRAAGGAGAVRCRHG